MFLLLTHLLLGNSNVEDTRSEILKSIEDNLSRCELEEISTVIKALAATLNNITLIIKRQNCKTYYNVPIYHTISFRFERFFILIVYELGLYCRAVF